MEYGKPGNRLQKEKKIPKQNQPVWRRKPKNQSRRKSNSDTINPQISTCRQWILINGARQPKRLPQSQSLPLSPSGNIHALPPTPAVVHGAARLARAARLTFHPPPTSPLSSLRTTPDLELIDPRILDPLWPGNGCPPSIDGTCPAVCADNGDAGIIHEELTDDPTITQFDALHIDIHQIGREGSGVTVNTTSANTSAARGNAHSTSPDLDSRDEPSDCTPAGDVQGGLFSKDLHQTSSTSEGL